MSRPIDANVLIAEMHNVILEDAEDRKTFYEVIERQQTIEPERKKGTWIPAFNGKFTGGAYWFNCSECGRIVPEVRNGGWNFCPNCGADMRGEKDEQR